MSDPAVEAAQRAWGQQFPAGPSWDVVMDFGSQPFFTASAREALKPIREMSEDQRFHGRGPHSQDWWDGATYILAELAPLIYATEELG